MKTIADINRMTVEEFVAAFGDVAEHCPWVARSAAEARPFASRDAMIAAFEAALHSSDEASQLALIRAHPDLATRAELTTDSSREQAGAGLDSLTPEEFSRFTDCNKAHWEKYGFPFIFAVKGASKHDILAAFEARNGNTTREERAVTLDQICRIFRFRIEDRVTL
ncbi:2-oxo-4-hydroxy-4-carboxy-5-ureidoimidazoline decarboxylase [Dongia soli]|uniref:2-oxo-4-hydroxy-4-carboxy-5-ureidoimidazoline decarboxylase n=1 Tax=Dongia soli TaxID=600628 RepID=A0ABU5E5N3_9PROT|nr:2-oxo-4-hydroxy-4-carboxy-5-ureidoimidazoline decarboxylase [Dongia soli]MDY0881608.1 2-oxo-4-hydroxy-4-carboxy-5-ureidoimidazoline decarboxylase [Dongia soli]